VLAFGYHLSHATARNAEAVGEFVVNFPPEALAQQIWAMPDSHGAERIQRSGLSLLPATTVAPPLIQECKAHLKYKLVSVTRLGAEVVIFGQILPQACPPSRDQSPPGAARMSLAGRPLATDHGAGEPCVAG
jgi:flavin reductase (DIM6/NTAB) family NADH-FMN oxidoreductase RutF